MNDTRRSKWRLDAPCEMSGFWWLPSDPGVKLAGTLKFDPTDGLLLDLLGTFRHEDRQGAYGEVLGQVARGVAATLAGCLTTSTSRLLAEPQDDALASDVPTSASTIRGQYVVLGEAIEDVGAASVRGMTMHVPGLEAWARYTPFSREETSARQSGIHMGGASWNCADVPDTAVLATPACKLVVGEQFREQHCSLPTPRLLVEHEVYLKLEYDEPRGLADVRRDAWLLQGFVSLAFGAAAVKDQLSVWFHDDGYGHPAQCPVLFATWAQAEKRALHDSMMPAPLGKMRAALGSIVSEWFKLAELCPDAISHLLNVQYQANMHLETNVLALVQALEIFHRVVVGGGNDLSEDTFAEFVTKFEQDLPETLPARFRNKVLSSLKHANEPTLSQRLKALDEILTQHAAAKALALGKDKRHRIVKARNELVHHGSLKSPRPHGPALAELRKTLRQFLTGLVLVRIGVPIDSASAAAVAGLR